LRYGAFRGLYLMDETDRNLHGELLNKSFWLHRVAPNSSPLVHVSARKRAEIVLFGEEPFLIAPIKLLVGDFTVTAEPGDDRCTVSRFLPNQDRVLREQCSLKLEDVLHALAELGGQYPEAIELLRKAHDRHCLTSPVVLNALPDTVPV